MATLDDFTRTPRIGYFSMEIALRNEIPTYSGGLGVLAGDTVRTAADLDLPLVSVTLVSREGYFRQSIDEQGRQVEQPAPWEPAQWAEPLGAKIAVRVEGRPVWIGAWLYVLEGHMGGRQPVVLLDTELDENRDDDRRITHYLYGGDEAYRLRQEIVLGIGGVRMLRALGFRLEHYHMNEGHSALLALELLNEHAYAAEDLRPGELPFDIPAVRDLCSFTTHTPVEAGHDRFPYDVVQRSPGDFDDLPTLRHLAGEDRLNMTRLAINLSEYVNGVAKRHAEVSRRMFPGYQVHAVTNGVHPATWTAQSFFRLYDAHLPGWCHEPELLVRGECCLGDDEVWTAHEEAKQALIEHIAQTTGRAFDPVVPIIGFARRMTEYKRPDLLFRDLDRLREIGRRWPLQIVLAGKAHPRDAGGKRLIEALHAHIGRLSPEIAVAYLPDYDMATAQALVSGSDVWLNTPLRPMEASGTSGMKAAFNAVPHLSVLDGWWAEACIEGVNGWAIGDDTDGPEDRDGARLYEKLEGVVLPLYHGDRGGWVRVMKGAIAKSAGLFNSHRMMRRYAAEAYLH
ncbi:MAG TPA: alpha-glucan family phosphorylase [Gammaproteobacteria bacterium]|nr:alpha-glucan family phosphorylase [Gammaproteobacteria bacterium]